MRKYSQVIQRYYVQYLSCYDGPALGQLLPNYIKMETEYMILNSIYNTISSLSVKQGMQCIIVVHYNLYFMIYNSYYYLMV